MRIFAFAVLAAVILPIFAKVDPASVSVQTDDDRFTVVSYRVSDAASVITFDVTTNGVSIGGEALSTARGDVYTLIQPSEAVRSFKLRLDRLLPDSVFEAGTFAVNVTAWPVNDPPNYMVVDLVTNSEVRVPAITYYPSVDHLPNGGLANRNYAKTKLVMRKIPAAYRRWQMGNIAEKSVHDVILTENYYMAIYELTGAQQSYMGGNTGATSEAPAVAGYNSWRGSAWPTGGHAGAAGAMTTYRNYTGLELDLPTEAQWEFAARAGEYGHTLYTGEDLVVTDNFAPMLDEIAWYGYNSQNAAGKCERKPVGLLKPNAYGLYDMLGNVQEYCLDFQRNLPGAATVETDPVGGTSGNRIVRGGTYNHAADRCTLISRRAQSADWWDDGENGVDGVKTSTQGIRLVCPAIAVR